MMHEHLQMMKFFEANLPGCRRLEYTTGCHPCVHFQRLGVYRSEGRVLGVKRLGELHEV